MERRSCCTMPCEAHASHHMYREWAAKPFHPNGVAAVQRRYGLSSRDLANFLTRAPHALLRNTTLFEAGRVAAWLRASVGLSPDYLASRVFAVYPQVATDPLGLWLLFAPGNALSLSERGLVAVGKRCGAPPPPPTARRDSEYNVISIVMWMWRC